MRLLGIGIDWVSLKRVRRFLETHSATKCEGILTPSEKKTWRQNHYSVVQFSKFFAAKEAFFKSVSGAWMALEGFGRLEVHCLPGGMFHVNPLLSGKRRLQRMEGYFFESNHGVGAHVILWE
ncbi:MAG TPA: 4'-phosphopantetheinyl transferase superfamily protein [bacterium]|nr:4'-phosphopantetheinyl transferase superfamily protein [bacterium]